MTYNFDFSLLVRCDVTPGVEEQECGVRKVQLRQRVRQAHATARMLLHSLHVFSLTPRALTPAIPLVADNEGSEGGQDKSDGNAVGASSGDKARRDLSVLRNRDISLALSSLDDLVAASPHSAPAVPLGAYLPFSQVS